MLILILIPTLLNKQESEQVKMWVDELFGPDELEDLDETKAMMVARRNEPKVTEYGAKEESLEMVVADAGEKKDVERISEVMLMAGKLGIGDYGDEADDEVEDEGGVVGEASGQELMRNVDLRDEEVEVTETRGLTDAVHEEKNVDDVVDDAVDVNMENLNRGVLDEDGASGEREMVAVLIQKVADEVGTVTEMATNEEIEVERKEPGGTRGWIRCVVEKGGWKAPVAAMGEDKCFGTTMFWTAAVRENLALEYDVLELVREMRRDDDDEEDGMWTRVLDTVLECLVVGMMMEYAVEEATLARVDPDSDAVGWLVRGVEISSGDWRLERVKVTGASECVQWTLGMDARQLMEVWPWDANLTDMERVVDVEGREGEWSLVDLTADGARLMRRNRLKILTGGSSASWERHAQAGSAEVRTCGDGRILIFGEPDGRLEDSYALIEHGRRLLLADAPAADMRPDLEWTCALRRTLHLGGSM